MARWGSGAVTTSTAIIDLVPAESPGAREIGFSIPERYNASRILFGNLVSGRRDKTAVIPPGGRRSYPELCSDASRWANGFRSLGLRRGDHVLMFLDDTPAYPPAFFGPLRAGSVPAFIHPRTHPDLLQL